MSLVAPRHMGSSRTRARARVPCIGRRILNHCTTREVLNLILLHVEIQFSQHNLLERLSLPHWMVLAPSAKII